jgi:P4 family phage/plasmid primase-like protien
MLGPDNYSTVPLEAFGRQFTMALTLGKLANICAEIGELDRTAEGTLKQFISGDPMMFEQKFKDGFTARPTARLILSTNNVPHFSDKSQGLWRRLILMPFKRRVPEADRVPGMDKAEYWTTEAPGILNWALEGQRRVRENKMRFTESAACRAALEAHRRESDPSRDFLLECYTADPDAKPLPAKVPYEGYKTWCETNGYKHTLTAQMFGKQVRRVFPQVESKSHRFGGEVQKAWFGVAPKDESINFGDLNV